jgi:L-lactate dehydrogenase complex protein LldG
MVSARETILWRIRHATRDVPEEERAEAVTVECGYRREDDASREESVGRFAENVAEYEATVRRVKTDELPGAIEEALERRGVKRFVVPPYLPKNGYLRASRPYGTRPDPGSPKRSSTAATAY